MSEVKNGKIVVDHGSSLSKITPINFPSNSHKSREEAKKVEKVTTGIVIQRKKPLGKRFMETFMGEDAKTVSSYIVQDILIPTIKSTISDIVQGGIEMLLFGQAKGNRNRNGMNNKPYNNYNGMSSYKPNNHNNKREISHQDRSRHRFDDIILGSRREAEDVLHHLTDAIDSYGSASVSDLYDLVGITGNFTDGKYGWYALGSASVSRVREGYSINLPKPILID